MQMELRPDERAPRLWTREEYDRMVDAGVLGPEDKVELIEGEILLMAPEGPAHSATVDLVRPLLERAFGPGFYVRPGHPLALDERSSPEPDLAVVHGAPKDYLHRHPATPVLVVEVSKTSLGFDVGRKLRLYARDRVPEYWVVDLVDRCVRVFREPGPDGYASSPRHDPGAEIVPAGATGTALSVADFIR